MWRPICAVVMSLVHSQAHAGPAGMETPPNSADRNLPGVFVGNDLALVIERFRAYSDTLSKIRKDEFETTAEFQARRRVAIDQELDAGVPIGARFAFTFPVRLQYDADTQRFTGTILGIPTSTRVSFYPSSNDIFGPGTYSLITGVLSGPTKLMIPYASRGGAYMVEQSTNHADGISFCWQDTSRLGDPGWRPAPACPLSAEAIRFEMPRARARELSPRLRLAVFGTIAKERPIVIGSSTEVEASPASPTASETRYTYLPFIPTSASIYDAASGQVIYRLNLAPQGRRTRPAGRQ
jgi:hypothetical protein